MRKKSSTHSRATIIDVAERAGVSIATVSRVLNETAPVAEETIEAVRKAVKELHFIPHSPARQLRSQRTRTLGVVLEEIGRDFFSPLLRGIEAGARETGYKLLVASTQGKGGAEIPGAHDTDGLLVFADSLQEDELLQLHDSGHKMVLLFRSSPPELAIPYVIVDNQAGARMMTDHLIEECGYRQIAFLRGPAGNEDSAHREMGYRESLEAHNIPFLPKLVGDGDFNEDQAQASIERMIRDGVLMDAVFAGDDDSAIGTMIALRRMELRVPEDIGVAGFDDIPAARYVTPSLTTIRSPIEKAGYEAARQLNSLIETGSAEPHVSLPTELIIRESCGYRLSHPSSQ